MTGTNEKRSVRTKARAAGHSGQANYVLRLYVSGMTPRSALALENVESICQEYLRGHYHLEVIDIYQNPTRMREDQVIAVPTLVKE